MDYKEILISKSRTHHIYKGKPLYDTRFNEVLKFHEPGLAPAKDSSGAFHINLEGMPAYSKKFKKCFGFYNMRSAAEDDIGWFHISANGEEIYSQRYAWVGNYQENIVTVRSFNGKYFHLDKSGNKIYKEEYEYAGDFKDSVAVVTLPNGYSTHIGIDGKLLHGKFYNQLDVFHKGFARAKDKNGWFHIAEDGLPIYKKRFLNLEPFYNGQALAEDMSGDVVIIYESGELVKVVSENKKDLIAEISSDITGFWKSEIIITSVRLKIFDILPSTLENISKVTKINIDKLERLLLALKEIDLVINYSNMWELTKKGNLLTSLDRSFMESSAKMWNDVSNEWKKLKYILQDNIQIKRRSFKERCIDITKLDSYKKAIKGYTLRDFSEVINWDIWEKNDSILGFGHSSITLIQEILKSHTKLAGAILNEDFPIYNFEIEDTLKNRIKKIYFNVNMEDLVRPDSILMPRFLHYYDDKDSMQILNLAFKFLKDNGKIYIFECLSDSSPLLDINMLVESGGELRNEHKWRYMLAVSGFSRIEIKKISEYLVCITGSK